MADLGPVLDFLRQLADNNDREWFQTNRDKYEQARDEFERFVEDVIDRLRPHEDMGPLRARDTTMRIYRDLRFTKDKTPYHTFMSASIKSGGRKSNRLGYYLHVEPGDRSFVASGLYQPPSAMLKRFRRAIAEDAGEFKRIINDEQFRQTFGEVTGSKVKTAPRGYSRDHPEIELLRMKDIVASRSFNDDAVRSDTFAAQVVEHFVLLMPLIAYLEKTAVF